ncbi:YtxH domain-containing protein [Staphylococcus epidermidis]|nr:YtxH domain-containing protein [Staphylococcus epidermidis]MDH9755244.1 YtxH domain-containing protein [Staphylococcus epidermidis]MDH9766589.1 YtxH domain-containing protein [Staphylococcus epidermidis]MDH9817901.1 YtxH domain-containing protein [Staphylococcus epidermidis]MDH9974279.1 YtxH domain-containing protein [Staphylococcus epidermidis]
MFNYYKSGFQKAKPHNLKLILLSLITFVICYITSNIAFSLVILRAQRLPMLAQFGESTTKPIISIIFILLILALLFIFVGYPLITGTVYAIQKAINKEKVLFSDLFFAFKKGKYAKSVILALITLVLFIVIVLILVLLNKLYSLALSPILIGLQQSISGYDNPMGILITIQIVLLLITGFISSIFYWFVIIFIINYTTTYTEDSSRKVMSNLKEGFKGIKNGKKTWFKFFIGVLLISLLASIINKPLLFGVQYLTSSMSQTVAQTIIIIARIVSIVLRLCLYYILIFGIINYFVRRGDKPVKSKRRHKNKDINKGNVNDKVDTKLNASNSKDTEADKMKDQQTHIQQDKTDSQENNIYDSIKEKVNENKENVTEQSKNLFDKK